MTFLIKLDGIPMDVEHTDSTTAITAARRIAAACPYNRVEVHNTDEPQFVYEAASGERRGAWSFDAARLSDVFPAIDPAQRRKCEQLCERLVELLGTLHTKLYPDASGDQVIMSTECAERLYELAVKGATTFDGELSA